jgi:hypothetical protein
MKFKHIATVTLSLSLIYSGHAQQFGTAKVPPEILQSTILIEIVEIRTNTSFEPVNIPQNEGSNGIKISPTQLAIRVEKPEVIFHPIGTAVLVTGSNVITGSNVMFLFTAKHVLASTEDVFFRIPQKNGQPDHRPFKQMLQETHTDWIRSTNADVAMTVFVTRYAGDTVSCVSLDSFAANYDTVTEGDEVLVSGYPASVIELPRPAVRGGLVSAKLDDEKLLIDVFTFPGNSGGPVFWKPSVGINVFGNQFGEGRYAKLIGLVLYSPLYTDQAIDPVTGRTRITFESNSGFTIIVSASRILELMDYPEVRAILGKPASH